LPNPLHSSQRWVWAAIALALCVGIFDRGYWTPDEPREADIAWRMSWQSDRAVPLLAGEAFCEKPPLTYWVAGAAMRAFGTDAWAARLPNLLYALATALAVGLIGRRAGGPVAGAAAAAAISTFLLSYQVVIWLASDAPLLAGVAVGLWGLYSGFYAERTAERLRGYSCMHAALAVAFLSKSAAAWMVPSLALVALVIWERRWRELWRWELLIGISIQAIVILTWVGYVYVGVDGPAHLKVFFWNNLAGRFAHVDAPDQFQYAAAHRNTPGKYLIELPVYLWPWTLLVMAAVRRAWILRHASRDRLRLVRFGVAVFAPTLATLSLAATARNIYLAPALPGLALLLGWWVEELRSSRDRWDGIALYATTALLLIGTGVAATAVLVVAADSADLPGNGSLFFAIAAGGLMLAAGGAAAAWRAVGRAAPWRALVWLVLAYCSLLVGPASQIYHRVDDWEDLASIGRAIGRDARDRPLILLAPDETTRAFIDMYARTNVKWVPPPLTPGALRSLRRRILDAPDSLVVVQVPGRGESPGLRRFAARWGLAQIVPAPRLEAEQAPSWAADVPLRVVSRYALPNGRRYALLEPERATSSR